MSNGLYTSALNQAIELCRLVDEAPDRDAVRQLAFDFGWGCSEREKDDLVAACVMINAIRTNHGLLPYPLVGAIESGYEACNVDARNTRS